jgi:hypothetical protein
MSHDLSADRLAELLQNIYNYSWHNKDGISVRGTFKKSFLKDGDIQNIKFEDKNMKALLQKLTTTISHHYLYPRNIYCISRLRIIYGIRNLKTKEILYSGILLKIFL